MSRLARFAWFTLVWNVGTILVGAYVRATGSGAGCGASWPTCRGELVPVGAGGAQAIEFSHRAVSGVAVLLVVVLAVGVFRASPAGSPVRKGAAGALLFVLGEAAIGAMLVLAQWVGEDDSVARAVAVPLHLVNTLALLAALALTAWWLSGGALLRLDRDPRLVRLLAVAMLGMVVLAATGAVTALADTLFPPDSLAAGLRQDVAGRGHFLTRLRVIHPVAAITVGVFVAMLARWYGGGAGTAARRLGLVITGTVAVQLAAGVLNVVLLTPEWVQLVHLLLADVLWVALVLFGAAVLAERVGPREQAAAAPAAETHN